MTRPTNIVIFPRDQLTESDKERFASAGVLVAEADDPNAVVRLTVSAPLVLDQSIVTGDAVVSGLLRAVASQDPSSGSGVITSAGRIAHEFVKQLAASLPKGKS